MTGAKHVFLVKSLRLSIGMTESVFIGRSRANMNAFWPAYFNKKYPSILHKLQNCNYFSALLPYITESQNDEIWSWMSYNTGQYLFLSATYAEQVTDQSKVGPVKKIFIQKMLYKEQYTLFQLSLNQIQWRDHYSVFGHKVCKHRKTFIIVQTHDM